MSVAFEIDLNVNKELTPEIVEDLINKQLSEVEEELDVDLWSHADNDTVRKLEASDGFNDWAIEYDRTRNVYTGYFRRLPPLWDIDVCYGLPAQMFVEKLKKTEGTSNLLFETDGFKLTVDLGVSSVLPVLTSIYHRVHDALETFLKFGKELVIRGIYQKIRFNGTTDCDFTKWSKDIPVVNVPISSWLEQLEATDPGITEEVKLVFEARALSLINLDLAKNFMDFENLENIYASPISLKNCGGELWLCAQLGYIYRTWLNLNHVCRALLNVHDCGPNPEQDIKQFFGQEEVNLEDGIVKLLYQEMQIEERRVASLGQTPDNA